MKKLFALLASLAIALLFLTNATTVPAQAVAYDVDTDGDTIPDYLEVSGWYNTRQTSMQGISWSVAENEWFHRAYPITCNTDSTLPAWQVLWITGAGTTADTQKFPDNPTLLQEIRKGLREVTSAFPASAGITVTTKAGLKTNHAPRWVTNTLADGTCTPQITKVTVPANLVDGAAAGSLASYLKNTLGYKAANRKYLAYIQNTSWNTTCGCNGVTWGVNDATPGSSNSHNGTGIVFVGVNQGASSGFLGLYSATAVHEMTHQMATYDSMPHNNTAYNPAIGQTMTGHVTDCFDIMCYDPAGKPDVPGQTYLTTCGHTAGKDPGMESGEARQSYRLDCGDDDYFAAPDQIAAGSWLTNHWNGYNSAYLWGGAVPATMPTAKTAAQTVRH